MKAERNQSAGSTGAAADRLSALPAAVSQAVRAQAKSVERLQASVAASAARIEQAFQGLAMRVDLLESSLEDAMRALRELQSTVAGLPTGIGVDHSALDRWSGEQADAVTTVEKQLITITGQLDGLRRRLPLRARPSGGSPSGLDATAIEAIADAVARRIKA